MEAPSSAYPRGTAGAGQRLTTSRGGDRRRFSPTPHTGSGGIDLPARTMDVCVLNQDGEVLWPRDMQAAPEPFLKAMASDREDVGGCVEGLFPWDGLADLCAPEGMPVVLGQALDLQALPGGQAKTDRMEAHHSAGLGRGGMLPQASVSPAARRATRDLRRRRLPLTRKRAEWLAPSQQTNRP